MASVLLSSLTGGGGGSFVAKFASPTVSVSSGATGTFATLTPPAGQKVKLTALASGGTTQTNLTTVTVGGVDVISAVILESDTTPPDAANQLTIGFTNPNCDSIIGDVDEVVELKTNVSTSQTTIYAYQFGE